MERTAEGPVLRPQIACEGASAVPATMASSSARLLVVFRDGAASAVTAGPRAVAFGRSLRPFLGPARAASKVSSRRKHRLSTGRFCSGAGGGGCPGPEGAPRTGGGRSR